MASDTMSISELLGLNAPRGLLSGCFGNGNASAVAAAVAAASAGTPPLGNNCNNNGGGDLMPQSLQSRTPGNYNVNSYDQFNKYSEDKLGNYVPSSTPLKRHFERHASLSSSSGASFSPSLRSASLSSSDCSGSNSPSMFDSGSGYRGNVFRVDSDGAFSSPDGSLTEILNTLTLNESFSRSRLNSNVDLINLQNLQKASHACNYLQSPTMLANACSPNLFDKWPSSNNTTSNNNHIGSSEHHTQLDRAARFHRSAALVYDANCTWSGVLPERKCKPVGFSSKVFLGGVPWDITEQLLIQTFKQFGPIRVEWPGKDKQACQPKGYAYIIFESEKNVKALLQACTTDCTSSNNWYYKISSKRMRAKEVQVIPWILNDSNYTKASSQKLDPARTVFVGALHGMLNAEGLAKIMNDLFDGVVYTGIDTDKYRYPIGSGRVTFSNTRSYMKAVQAGFIEIKTEKFTKEVQVDPYLEDSLCSMCQVQQGPYFCRERSCFRYFCRTCWSWQHEYQYAHHKPLMRNSKHSTILGLNSSSASGGGGDGCGGIGGEGSDGSVAGGGGSCISRPE